MVLAMVQGKGPREKQTEGVDGQHVSDVSV